MRNLPALRNVESYCALIERECAKAPALAEKIHKIEEARRFQFIAKALSLRKAELNLARATVRLEKMTIDNHPPIPPKERYRGNTQHSMQGISQYKIWNMRKAYKGLTFEQVSKKADEAVENNKTPTRSMFLENREMPHRTKTTGNDERYTPKHIIELARNVMGAIDTDPASCHKAQKVVKASQYFTKEDNGLKQDWLGNVWMNPPYSINKIGSFVDALIMNIAKGHTTKAIVLTHNCTDTKWAHKLFKRADFICLISGRLRFSGPGIDDKGAPLQGQIIYGFKVNKNKFFSNFNKVGVCWKKI